MVPHRLLKTSHGPRHAVCRCLASNVLESIETDPSQSQLSLWKWAVSSTLRVSLWGDSWSRVTGRSGRSDMADQVIDGRLRTSLVQESFQPEVTSQSILSGEDETRQSQDGVLPAVNARGETRSEQRRADSCLLSCVRLLQIMYIRARISGRQGPPPVPNPTVFGGIYNRVFEADTCTRDSQPQ